MPLISLRITEEQDQRLRERGSNRSDLIRAAIDQYLGRTVGVDPATGEPPKTVPKDEKRVDAELEARVRQLHAKGMTRPLALKTALEERVKGIRP